MSLCLTSADVIGVARACRALLAPLEHPTVADWQSHVGRELKALLGADKASMLLPDAIGSRFFSEEIPLADTSAYPAVIRPLDTRWSVWQRQAALGAWDRTALWQPWLEEYLRSAYFHEFVVPLRLYDALGLTVNPDGGAAAATEQTTASLWLHHDRSTGGVFGARGLAIFALLLPAFSGGVEALVRLAGRRTDLARTLDAIDVALMVVDGAGRVLHRTTALSRLLQLDPDSTRLSIEMAKAAGAAARVAAADGWYRGQESCSFGFTRQVITNVGCYTVRAMLAPSTFGAAQPTTLVSLRRTDAAWPTPEALIQRLGLTHAQARVALLVAQGMRYPNIAVSLAISPHTVRRHAEAVRAKLGVHNATEVATIVLGRQKLAT